MLAKLKSTDENIILKRVISKEPNRSKISNYMQEIKSINDIENFGILKVYGIDIDDGSIFEDYVENRSLHYILTNEKKQTPVQGWNETKRFCVAYGIAAIMATCHQHGIFHLRLSPRKILLNNNFEPMIDGFVLHHLYEFQDQQNQNSFIDLPNYVSPEIILGLQNTEKADIYSYGMILYSMYSLFIPFSDTCQNYSDLFYRILTGSRPVLLESIPDPWKKLIENMWNQDPAKRPTFMEIVKYLDSSINQFITWNMDKSTIIDYCNKIRPKDINYDIEIIKKKADCGSPHYQAIYGKRLLLGEGVKQDTKQSLKYLQSAASQNDSLALCYLGYYFENEEDQLGASKAVSYYQQAIDANSYEAMSRLGILLRKGIGVPKRDPERAFECFKTASEHKDPLGQLLYGRLLIRGEDLNGGLSLLREASDQNFAWASYELGLQVKEKSPEDAFRLFQKAQKDGYLPAIAKVGECLMYGIGCSKDANKGYSVLHDGSQRGIPECHLELAKILIKGQPNNIVFQGQCVTQNVQEGRRLLKLALESNLPQACTFASDLASDDYNALLQCNPRNPAAISATASTIMLYLNKAGDYGPALSKLGKIYKHGNYGLPVDIKKSLEMYQKAADLSYPPGLSGLGRFYEDGIAGIEKDIGKAIQYYRKAAQMGDPEGSSHLGRMYLMKYITPFDPKKVEQLFTYAGDHGVWNGYFNLGSQFSMKSSLMPYDIPKAIAYYEKAIPYYPLSATHIGNFYKNGEGVPKNLKKAEEYYRIAAQHNIPEGYRMLGYLYEMEYNKQSEAFEFYLEAAKRNDPFSINQMGRYYENKGMIDEALKYYAKPCMRNDPYALRRIVELNRK